LFLKSAWALLSWPGYLYRQQTPSELQQAANEEHSVVQENRKVISYTGMIGRKYFFINYLILWLCATGVLIAFFAFVAVIAHFLFHPDQETLRRMFTGLAIPLAIGMYVLFTGLFIRRIRDMFEWRETDGFRDTAIVLGFIFTGGLCMIGYLFLLFWPGLLSKQATAAEMSRINS
jgi:hypothetical protein